jgi:hypothetical protein
MSTFRKKKNSFARFSGKSAVQSTSTDVITQKNDIHVFNYLNITSSLAHCQNYLFIVV